MYESRKTPVPLKARYMKKDLADWARSAGLAIKMPPRVFPVNSVKAMRGCLWLLRDTPDKMVPFATAVFEAYWGRDLDISMDAVLHEICAERRPRSGRVLRRDRRTGDQGSAQGQHR